MGRNKALLPVAGTPCIQIVADALKCVCREVLVVADDPAPYAFLSLRVVPDRLHGSGPLAGIESGLAAASTERVLVLSCDLPSISGRFLGRLCELSGEEEVLLPVGEEGRPQPLCAIYRRSCLPSLERELGRGVRSVLEYLNGRVVRTVPLASILEAEDDPGLLFNMNTPAKYDRAASGRSARS